MKKNKTKLILRGVTHNGKPFIKEIHTLDEVKSSGNYTVVCRNASNINGLPSIIGHTENCFCCEAQLNVTCCYPEDETQSNTAYGQTLTICDRETGSTNTYTRTITPTKNNGKWSQWQMAATGDIELVTQNSDITKQITALASEQRAEVIRATKSDTTTIEIPLSITEYYVNEAHGGVQQVDGKGYCGLIPVKPGEKYLYSGEATEYTVGVAGYDSNGNFLYRIICKRSDAIVNAGVCNDVLFTIPQNVAFIACSTNNQESYPLSLKKTYTAIEYEQRETYSEVAYNKRRGCCISTTTGEMFLETNCEATDFIPVKAGDIIKYTGLTGSERGVVCFDSQKKYHSSLIDASKRDGVHFIAKNAIDTIAVIPSGCSYIRASSNDYINNPLSIKIQNGSLNYGKKYVWFGDSISQLGSLPHQTGAIMGVDVIDVSFAGAPLTYSSSDYQGTGFMELVNCIIDNDYSIVENALAEQVANGVDITDKNINLKNLKDIDWQSVTNIVVMAGTNDLTVSSATVDKIRNGLSSALQKFISKYQHISLNFISPPWRANNTNDINGLTTLAIVEVIGDVCKNFSIPFLDFYHSCGVNEYNKSYFLNDGLHPTLSGESLWSTKIAHWLKSV